jgi:hypothetical protein
MVSEYCDHGMPWQLCGRDLKHEASHELPTQLSVRSEDRALLKNRQKRRKKQNVYVTWTLTTTITLKICQADRLARVFANACCLVAPWGLIFGHLAVCWGERYIGCCSGGFLLWRKSFGGLDGCDCSAHTTVRRRLGLICKSSSLKPQQALNLLVKEEPAELSSTCQCIRYTQFDECTSTDCK